MAGFRIPGPLRHAKEEGVAEDGVMRQMFSPSPHPIGLLGPVGWSQMSELLQKRNMNMSDELSFGGPAISAGDRKDAKSLSLSEQALSLLKGIETLRLKPYDDQTGKEITAWVKGATIGYGHLIKQAEWATYKGGVAKNQADALFAADLAPYESAVGQNISAQLKQNEFDALVILAFNIGSSGFATSSVVKLVNDPKAKTSYNSLESAWKAWNKSQGKVNAGLENRRKCEWKIYAQGVYERW